MRIVLIVAGAIAAILAGLVILGLLYGNDSSQNGNSAWTLKAGNDRNLYAIAVPRQSTLNLKAIVLACDFVDGARVLTLQLYPSTPGPLLPNGASRSQLRDDPHVRLEIDGAVVAAKIYFADEFAVVADQVLGGRPVIGAGLGGQIEKGKELTVRLDLVRDQSRATPYDAYAVVAIDGSKPIASVRRRCGQ